MEVEILSATCNNRPA